MPLVTRFGGQADPHRTAGATTAQPNDAEDRAGRTLGDAYCLEVRFTPGQPHARRRDRTLGPRQMRIVLSRETCGQRSPRMMAGSFGRPAAPFRR